MDISKEVLAIVIILIIWLFFVISQGFKNRKKRDESLRIENEIHDQIIEIVYKAYSGDLSPLHFANYSLEVFTDERVYEVIGEEIKRQFNNLNDFTFFQENVSQLPREVKLIFDTMFMQVCEEVDILLIEELKNEAVKEENEEAQEMLKILIKKLKS